MQPTAAICSLRPHPPVMFAPKAATSGRVADKGHYGEISRCLGRDSSWLAAALAGAALDRHADRLLLAAAARGVVKVGDNRGPHRPFDEVAALDARDFVQAAHDGLVAAAVVVTDAAVVAVVV